MRLLDALIDRHNPGVTLLVVVWTAGLALRRYLEHAGSLSEIADQALLSLLYVVPLMLAGWGFLAMLDRPRRDIRE